MMDKKGYNFRISCLYSLDICLKNTNKETHNEVIIPLFKEALQDQIPNVVFTALKILQDNRSLMDPN